MKYELNEGQYATFLNVLTPGQARRRTPLNTKGYQEFHGSITYTEGGWAALHPGRPAGFLSWRDLLAYADWAALRPMTELEYTKACRGAREPVPGGYAWGSDSRRGVRRGLDENGFLISNGLREDDLSTDGNALAFFGASYYRVLELSGSLWEWTVSIGHPEGRDFTGEPGDGQLRPAGEADAPGWPLEQGFGFRGSFYHTGDDPLDLRTYTPVAERPFAGLNDKTRRRWYGGRLVR
jgi:formylglycine-generating enzyme required for sulfatase activity